MSPTRPPSTVLVRLPNPLGDVVMATPLLRSLRTAWPQTRIVAAGNKPFGPLLDGLDSVDEFLPLGGEESQADILRQAAADMVLLLPNSWSSAVAAWRARIPLRIGRRNQGRRILLHRSLPPIRDAAPMTELFADFLPLLGLPREVPRAELVVTSPPATHLPPDAKLLAVAAGAAFGPSKIYPAHLLQETLEILTTKHDFTPLLLGSPAERGSLETLAAALPGTTILPSPQHGGLDETKALLKTARVVLAMDNGARHMAAALGTPQVVLYGPTHPAWSAHALEKTTLLRREELDCLNCHQKICPLADHPCMTRITPETVAEAVCKAAGD